MKEESQKQKMKSNEEILTELGSIADSSKDELVGKQIYDSICKAMDLAREDERSRLTQPMSKEKIEEILRKFAIEIRLYDKTTASVLAEYFFDKAAEAISQLSIPQVWQDNTVNELNREIE